jgi:MoaA/NifB/PqqE/SkfB family radical SAM enzyme
MTDRSSVPWLHRNEASCIDIPSIYNATNMAQRESGLGKSDTGLAFEASILDVLRTGLRVVGLHPTLAVRAVRLLRGQQAAARRRDGAEARGVHVPPFVIYSVTGNCNLACSGCYANLLHRTTRPELDDARMDALLTEASDLGVSVMLLAGGEPLMREGLLERIAAHPEILFLLFTNGTLLDDHHVRQLRNAPHVIPVVSVEGGVAETDARRGPGTHRKVMAAVGRLRRARHFFGTSTTLTRQNFALATGESHLRELIRSGCRLFYYINYVPVQGGTEDLELTSAQVEELERRLKRYRKEMPALFIAFPHDEVALGGCLAAGRGFLHIDAYGDVEPCPFSPYSDSNLLEMTFEEALASPLLQAILTSGVYLDESDGRCALWKRREWVASLLEHGSNPDNAARRF